MLAYNLQLPNTNILADLFINLPQEIIIDILSRLCVRSITRCKCVCKSWCDLIMSVEFVSTHHSKSTSTSSSSGLALIEDITSSKPYKTCDEIGVDGCAIISNFGLPTHHHIQDPKPMFYVISSTDGLLLLFDGSTNLFICNPITREYIKLPPLPMYLPYTAKFGFGASKVTGQYKLMISFSSDYQPCIYSLETGLWRSIIIYNTACMHGYDTNGASAAALLNGNLHWLGRHDDFDPTDYSDDDHYYNDQQMLISCFDLETEQFTSISLPPHGGCTMLSVLEGRLCLCDNVCNYDDKIVIWLMNKYGDASSWTKEFIINTPSLSLHHLNFAFLFPVKVFGESGDILFGRDSCGQLFFYSNDTKTIREYGHLQVCGSYSSKVVDYTPSFLSLKTMGFQNVTSF